MLIRQLWRTSPVAALALVLTATQSSVYLGAQVREPRVEVRCPAPPVPVRVEDRLVLAYELHLTSFEPTSVRLTNLQVFTEATGPAPLVNYAGATLAAAVQVVGQSSPDAKGIVSLSPGQRAVAFMWVEPKGNPPARLRHRLTFTRPVATNASGEETTLEQVDVVVRQVSSTRPITLSPPFRGGVWLAGTAPSNTSVHRRGIAALQGGAFIGQRFAVDFVKVGTNDDTTHDGHAKNENYWGYGEPVLAVGDGEVTEALNDRPDNLPHTPPPPLTVENIAGNHVIVRVAPATYVTFAHLQPGSITVRVGDRVKRGQVIGRLGNSGNSSGPHLHLQVSDANSVLASEGLPFVFDSYQHLGSGADYPEKQASQPRTRTLPGENSVVRFHAGT